LSHNYITVEPPLLAGAENCTLHVLLKDYAYSPQATISKKHKSRLKTYVNHPRFGDTPCNSGIKVSLSDILAAHWSLEGKSTFPETAIPADTSKQNYSVFPRTFYVDIEKQCRQCRRWFLFYALEQRFWYETLGFYVDADCVRCPDCRKDAQRLKQQMLGYQHLLVMPQRSAAQTREPLSKS
jgi:hypothetical protein